MSITDAEPTPAGIGEPILELLNGFVVELRNAGIPVSLTENLDAMEAVKFSPLEDREAFKYALAATLVKNQSHWKAFETVFDVTTLLGGGKYLWQMHSSGDDRVHSATVKDASTYQDLGCIVYREDTRQHRFYTPRGDYDECQIDKSGRWLVIKENVDNQYNEDNRVIDIETGAYEMDDDQLTAIHRLLARYPEAQIWCIRVGYPYVDRM